MGLWFFADQYEAGINDYEKATKLNPDYNSLIEEL